MLSVDDKGASGSPGVRRQLLAALPAAVDAVEDAVITAAPPYVKLFGSRRGPLVREQIDTALRTYLRLTEARPDGASDSPGEALLRPAVDAAFELGRNEADLGRGTETLMTAFRVGARTTWRSFAQILTSAGMSGAEVATHAEQLFDFIDQLSAAAVAGHEFQSSRFLRARDAEREQLVRDLVLGREPGAERWRRAEWQAPDSVAVLVAADSSLGRLRDRLPSASLLLADELPAELSGQDGVVVALVPGASARRRKGVLHRLGSVRAVLGPDVALVEVDRSFRWAVRVWNDLAAASTELSVDVEDHIVDVLLAAEPVAIDALRRKLLQPFDGLSASTRERLEETLRLWIDLRGRHDLVAAALHVHPQTVRYRIGQVQHLIGAVLADPAQSLALRLALTR